jgi:hypothetical protein
MDIPFNWTFLPAALTMWPFLMLSWPYSAGLAAPKLKETKAKQAAPIKALFKKPDARGF